MKDGAVAGGEPGAQHHRGGYGASPESKRRMGVGQVCGEVIERALDRVPQLLQAGPARGPGQQGGVDRVAELAGKVGTQASQRARPGAARAGRDRKSTRLNSS